MGSVRLGAGLIGLGAAVRGRDVEPVLGLPALREQLVGLVDVAPVHRPFLVLVLVGGQRVHRAAEMPRQSQPPCALANEKQGRRIEGQSPGRPPEVQLGRQLSPAQGHDGGSPRTEFRRLQGQSREGWRAFPGTPLQIGCRHTSMRLQAGEWLPPENSMSRRRAARHSSWIPAAAASNSWRRSVSSPPSTGSLRLRRSRGTCWLLLAGSEAARTEALRRVQ